MQVVLDRSRFTISNWTRRLLRCSSRVCYVGWPGRYKGARTTRESPQLQVYTSQPSCILTHVLAHQNQHVLPRRYHRSRCSAPSCGRHSSRGPRRARFLLQQRLHPMLQQRSVGQLPHDSPASTFKHSRMIRCLGYCPERGYGHQRARYRPPEPGHPRRLDLLTYQRHRRWRQQLMRGQHRVLPGQQPCARSLRQAWACQCTSNDMLTKFGCTQGGLISIGCVPVTL